MCDVLNMYKEIGSQSNVELIEDSNFGRAIVIEGEKYLSYMWQESKNVLSKRTWLLLCSIFEPYVVKVVCISLSCLVLITVK